MGHQPRCRLGDGPSASASSGGLLSALGRLGAGRQPLGSVLVVVLWGGGSQPIEGVR